MSFYRNFLWFLSVLSYKPRIKLKSLFFFNNNVLNILMRDFARILRNLGKIIVIHVIIILYIMGTDDARRIMKIDTLHHR